VNATSDIELKPAELSALLEETIRAGRISLPVMPDVAAQVNEAVRSRNVGARDLARIIEASPGLTARILKMANSAMYAGLNDIGDLSHAIGRLGATMVLAVVIGAAGKETFHSDHPDWDSLLETTWMSSVFASGSCRLLGARVGEMADECFLAGLLHGVGEPILIQAAEHLVKAKSCSSRSSLPSRRALERGSWAPGGWLTRWSSPSSSRTDLKPPRQAAQTWPLRPAWPASSDESRPTGRSQTKVFVNSRFTLHASSSSSTPSPSLQS